MRALDSSMVWLGCHPATPCAAVSAIAVTARRVEAALTLHYQLVAAPERLSLPARAAPQCSDGLWRTTCAEAFVSKPDVTGYVELNFSPSTQWAAYQFDDYRQGMTPLAINAPQIVVTPHDHAVEIAVSCALPPSMAAASSLHLGLNMVVADQQGGLSYWALHHAADKPDFHHRDGFVLEL